MATSPATQARIRADWDTSITYDVLRAKGATIPVFVGRAELLQPLVATICETRKRGTILISGHRGTGKTTLLIEALRQAGIALEKSSVEGAREKSPTNGQASPAAAARATGDKQKRLLPIVLNVSEVSASLEQETQESRGLSIDPKRLLIALMRSFAYQRRRGTHFDDASFADLRKLIDDLYIKAIAADFSRSTESGKDEASSVERDVELSLKVENVLKAAPFLTGTASIVFALLGWGASTTAFKVLSAIAAIATLALSITWKRSKSASESRAERLSYKLDNSLQQIENDLKDLLDQLAERGFRTVVVLEELDKLDQAGEQQLDAVIRYFKNLFTQAPALFFFVTDKHYFDSISAAIRDARRRRSYAVEHTFFSSRIFVGRPETRDCLEYLSRILLDDRDRELVKRIYTSPRFATESYGAGAAQSEPLSLFARLLLFRASNHLFDLKNELRRFVRQSADGDVVLQFDEEMLPAEERALAKFQDLIAEKFRAFEIKGGRSYANEVLNECLYSVFNQFGSAAPQSIQDLLPQTAAAGTDPIASDSLDIAEAQRIEQAVRSMLEDLQRGFAVTVDASKGTFTWLANAASVFTIVRRLEKHEDDLVLQLKRAAATAELLLPRLDGVDPDIEKRLREYAEQKVQRADEVANLDITISLDAATQEQRELEKELGKTLEAAQTAHCARVGALFQLAFSEAPIIEYDNGSTIRLLETADGDPRRVRTEEIGCVLLAHGVHERIVQDSVQFAATSRNLRRLALVHVLPPGTTPEECLAMEARHHEAAGEMLLGAHSNVPAPLVPMRVRALPLDEPPEIAGTAPEAWGMLLGRELLVQSYWATHRTNEPARETSEWSPLARALNGFFSREQAQDAVCFVEGATDEHFVSAALLQALRSFTDIIAAPVKSVAGEIDYEAALERLIPKLAYEANTAKSPRDTRNYAGAVGHLLAAPDVVLVAHDSQPLQRMSTAFAGTAPLVYLGVPAESRLLEEGRATVTLNPTGQFRTKSGIVGPSEPQKLTLRWGTYPGLRAAPPTPAKAIRQTSAPASSERMRVESESASAQAAS